MQTPSEPPVEFERSNETLLLDSLILGMLCQSLSHTQSMEDYERAQTLARSSIIASVLFIEACANCCIDHLALSTRFESEVDRLSTAAKLDMYLQLRFDGRALDRARSEYQGYAELKKLRDAFAHPKAQRFQWQSWSPEEAESYSPTTSLLSLPLIPSYCGPETVPVVLRATHEFMAYFFDELCRMRPKQVSALLFSSDKTPDLKAGVVPYWHKHIHTWLREQRIPISYVYIGERDA